MTNKVDYAGLQSLLAIPNLQTSVYDFAMKSVLARGFLILRDYVL